MRITKGLFTISLLAISLIIIYFVFRLTHLMTLPMFTDEAIYTRWSQIANQDASWRFISLTDGKQPMFIWIDLIFMRFIYDPLLAGRLVSVVAGFVTTIGLFFLTRELFKSVKVGIIASLLYVIYPFALVYDRMALYDSLVAMFVIWGLYIEVLLVKRVQSSIAFIAALVIGGGLLTKTNAFFNIYFLPVTLLLFDFKQKHWTKNLSRWFLYAFITTVLAYLYYSILRLSPYFGIIAEKDHTFIYSFSEWLKHPFTFFVGNMNGLWDWFLQYTTWAGVVLIVVSLLIAQRFWKEKILLLFWSSAPFLALALFGKVLYPRYVFPMAVTVLPLIALSLIELGKQVKGRILLLCVGLILFGLWLWKDYYIIFDFAHAPIAQSDLAQYSNAWPAGGGLKEIIGYLSQQATKQKIFVLSEGTFGSLPTYGVEIYLGNNKNVEKQGVWPVPDNLPDYILQKAKDMPTFVILSQTQSPPISWRVTLIAKYKKGAGTDYMSLYRVNKY